MSIYSNYKIKKYLISGKKSELFSCGNMFCDIEMLEYKKW